MATKLFLVLILANCALASQYFDLQCSGDVECSGVESAVCDTSLQQCYCPGYSVLSSNMLKCLQVATGPGEACEEDAQCSTSMLTGGACVDSKCTCVEGMHYHLGRCWSSKRLGESCTNHAECSILSAPDAAECRENVCTCNVEGGFYQREYSDCRPTVTEVGAPCSMNSDCRMADSYCASTKVCACYYGQFNSTSCFDTPQNDTETMGLRPYRSNIQRLSGFRVNGANKRLGFSNNKDFGSECQVDSDCSAMGNAMCTPSGYCVCDVGYFPTDNNGLELCVPEIGALCTEDDECGHLESSICSSTGVCTCIMGYSMSDSRKTCIKQTTKINYECSEDAQCLLFGPRAYCKTQGSAKVCACEAGSQYLTDDVICWLMKKPSESCLEERDCGTCASGVCGLELVTCSNNTCECDPGYHVSADGINCNLDAPYLGDLCTDSIDCLVANAECKDRGCRCKTGYYEDQGQCLTGVGGKCSTMAECSATNLTNVECKNSKCTCLTGYVASADIQSCLPIGTEYGANCTEVQQCTGALGTYAACTDGLCDCAKNHHLVDGDCIPSRGLGETCDQSTECYLPEGTEGLVCRNYKCSCDYGYTPGPYDVSCISKGYMLQTSILLVTVLSAIAKTIL